MDQKKTFQVSFSWKGKKKKLDEGDLPNHCQLVALKNI
jgi:hypothetical protein